MISDSGEQFLFVLSIKWRLANQHLVQQDSVGPPVNTGSVGLVVDDLRSYVVRSPAEGLGGRAVPDSLLAHPEVGNLDVSLLVQHDIVQLEVPVDDPVGVEVHDSDQNFSSVEPVGNRNEKRR